MYSFTGNPNYMDDLKVKIDELLEIKQTLSKRIYELEKKSCGLSNTDIQVSNILYFFIIHVIALLLRIIQICKIYFEMHFLR